MGQRTLQVDDREIHYLDQIFWAGLASSCYLPSTIIPTGVGERGLPIGAQIVGPEFGDLITIGVAQVLEREGLRFESPPGYP